MSCNCCHEDRDQLFQILKEKAFFKEKIILSSGKESDYYIDARRITLSSDGAYFCAKIILDMVKDETYDAIGGPTLGADPFLGALNVLSHQAGQPLKTFIIRKAPKAHGKQQQIEGPLLPDNAEVVLVDDVATTGKAFVESIDVLAKAGMRAKKAICIVDRGEGAKEAVVAKGVELVSIFTAEDFLNN
ncbi:MAG: orotate phosphoribosyltransferase [Candidatus Omnitrophica bacterium]|nr:orotate phosphoribosyltransferase [Candidatus Omnitrophota bacterium]